MHDQDWSGAAKQAKWPTVSTLGEAKPGQVLEVAWLFHWTMVRVCWIAGEVAFVRIIGWNPGARQGPWQLPCSLIARNWKPKEENSPEREEGVFFTA